jgi:hypothetical protein
VAELEALLGQIVARIARHLERRGLVVRDAEGSYLSAGPAEEAGLCQRRSNSDPPFDLNAEVKLTHLGP